MARRDRQRRRRAGNPGPRPSDIHRENVPGSLDHVGEADEFEAAIVAGAEGVPEPDDAAAGDGPDPHYDEIPDEDFDDVEDAVDEAAAEAPGGELAERPRRRRERRTAATPLEPAGHHGGFRAIGFLRACWAELQRVQWPDRRQVAQATAVVLGFVIVAGAYLGLADVVAQRIIDFIL
jgi:preprotein translocase SecE subunit